jgi:hypothetical protein
MHLLMPNLRESYTFIAMHLKIDWLDRPRFEQSTYRWYIDVDVYRNRSSNSAAVDPQAESGEGEKKGPSKSELKKMAKEAEKEKKRIEREAKEAAAKAAREAADVVSYSMLCYTELARLQYRLCRWHSIVCLQDFATQNYGLLPLHQSQERHGKMPFGLCDINRGCRLIYHNIYLLWKMQLSSASSSPISQLHELAKQSSSEHESKIPEHKEAKCVSLYSDNQAQTRFKVYCLKSLNLCPDIWSNGLKV